MTRQGDDHPRCEDAAGRDPLEVGLAAAFGPDSAAATVDESVLHALGFPAGSLPRVQLRDPSTEPVTPVLRPGSPEMPAAADPGGRYQLFGEIARGGMGAVLKGRDADLGRDIAVKVLLEAHHGKPELLQRFVEEAQIGGQLQHPGVVPVYALGKLADGRPFFAMKLVKGRTLSALLAERKGPCADRSHFLGVFAQVCQTLAYAHARGVIHRDLKPSNVMVGAFGEVQVMDWGLAKVLSEGGLADEPREPPPEEASVIRTARSAGSGSESKAGSVLGTPAYMSPEQARGEVDKLDKRCDVFGLGALLCQILTGQPPYVGRDGDEVMRKARGGATAEALARLDGGGADAELVLLAKRCLAAAPEDRPRHAGVLADEVTAYLNSVETRLRQAELAGAEARARAAEERKRRRLTVALAAFVVATALGGGGVGLWLKHDHDARQAAQAQQAAALERDVRAALTETALYQAQAKWSAARAALERARGRLGNEGPAELIRQVDQAERDLKMVGALEEIRLRQAEVREDMFDVTGTDELYATAFQNYGLDVLALPAAEAAGRLKAAAIRLPLLTGLYDWAFVKPARDREGRERLRALLRAADDDPWRRKLFDPAWQTKARLAELARQADVGREATVTVLIVSRRLGRLPARAEEEALLRRLHRQVPADFWVNQDLATCLLEQAPARLDEAIGFYRAAVALRPESPGVRLNLGIALRKKGRLDDALAAFQEAIRLHPTYAGAHDGLGGLAQARGRPDEAVACYQEALRLEPQNADAHLNLGLICRDQGRLDRAAAAFREATRLRPKDAAAHRHLGWTLWRAGRPDAALAECREALRLQPDDHVAHTDLGVYLRDRGKRDEASDSFRRALRLKPDFADAHANLGRTLAEAGRFAEAAAACREVVRLRPDDAEAHRHLGWALWRAGRLDAAIASCQTALRLQPNDPFAHTDLGLYVQNQGKLDEAIASFRRALRLKSDLADARNNLDAALGERQRLRRLPGILFEEERPRDAAEAVAFARICDRPYRQLYAAAARLYRDAFAARPALADNITNYNRYDAACAATLAGCGWGKDDPPPDAAARRRWRQQAREWLRADLKGWDDLLGGGKEADRITVGQRLRHWQQDADFRGVRGDDALAKLPAAERDDGRRLWADVEALRLQAEATRKGGTDD